jgi:hypothetical protein
MGINNLIYNYSNTLVYYLRSYIVNAVAFKQAVING